MKIHVPKVVCMPHHIKACEMADCKKCHAYEFIDEKTFYCSKRNKRIIWVKNGLF